MDVVKTNQTDVKSYYKSIEGIEKMLNSREALLKAKENIRNQAIDNGLFVGKAAGLTTSISGMLLLIATMATPAGPILGATVLFGGLVSIPFYPLVAYQSANKSKKSIISRKDVSLFRADGTPGLMVARDKELRENNFKKAVLTTDNMYNNSWAKVYDGDENIRFNNLFFKKLKEIGKTDLEGKLAYVLTHEITLQLNFPLDKKITYNKLYEHTALLFALAGALDNRNCPNKAKICRDLAQTSKQALIEFRTIEPSIIREIEKNAVVVPLSNDENLKQLSKELWVNSSLSNLFKSKTRLTSDLDVRINGKMVERDSKMRENDYAKSLEYANKHGFGNFEYKSKTILRKMHDYNYTKLLGQIAYVSNHELTNQLYVPSGLNENTLKRLSEDFEIIIQDKKAKCPVKCGILGNLKNTTEEIIVGLREFNKTHPTKWSEIDRIDFIPNRDDAKAVELSRLLREEGIVRLFKKSKTQILSNTDVKSNGQMVSRDAFLRENNFAGSLEYANKHGFGIFGEDNSLILSKIRDGADTKLLGQIAYIAHHELTKQLEISKYLEKETLQELSNNLTKIIEAKKVKCPVKCMILENIKETANDIIVGLRELEKAKASRALRGFSSEQKLLDSQKTSAGKLLDEYYR